MSYVFRLVLSNGLAFVCFLLVIFSSIHNSKGGMLRIKLVTLLLSIVVYAIIGCYYAVAANLFAALRNVVCLKYPNRKEGAAVKAAVLVAGTAFSAWCGYRGGGAWVTYLPAVSFLFYSSGIYLTKSPSAMRIINAVDILLFWFVFDYLNLMAFNVVNDLFAVLFPLVERYVKLDHTEPAERISTSESRKSKQRIKQVERISPYGE